MGSGRRNRLSLPLSFAVAATLALGAPGCSFLGPSTQKITITATDSGAEIYVDGTFAGIGSAIVDLSVNESHGIMARVGDRTGSQQLSPMISMLGILDVVGAFLILIPIIGIFAPGFWQHDKDRIQITIPAPGGSSRIESRSPLRRES